MGARIRVEEPQRSGGGSEDRAGPGGAKRSRERRTALEISVSEGAFATAHSALTGNGIGGNVFSTGFALLLGATNIHLGILTALPQIATTGQTASAYLLERVHSRKSLVLWSCAVARGLFFVAPFLPLALGREAALPAFMALFGVAAFTYQFAGNAWTSWMADLVPRRLRGRYFSQRSNFCNLVGLLVGVAGAFVVERWGFTVLFVTGAGFGAVSTFLLRFQTEPVHPARTADDPAAALPLRDLVATPFRDESFRRVLLFLAAFSFVNGLGNPFWIPYVLEDLGRSYRLVAGLTLAGGVAGLLTLPLWGRALDRFGAKPCMMLAALVTVLHPLYYLVATPTFVAPIYLDFISSGVMWGGWNLALFNLLLSVAPERRGREMYIAAQAGAVGLSLAAGSIVAGVLADTIPDGRRTIFALVSILRLTSLVLLARVHEPRARPLGELLLRARRTLFGV